MTALDAPFWYTRLYLSLQFKRWVKDCKERIVQIWRDMVHAIKMMRPQYREEFERREINRLRGLPPNRSWREITDPNLRKVKAKPRRRAR